ncbi:MULTISPECIES: FlxA-like family protein [Achromobacter]|uniref:FlxA-like family protein n=1 Tax=Achromobacter spanius TaxID=217203 RepID=A0ABY8H0F6_9BURK|nr:MULTISPECIES: FlxA-like family protein [Achromobacter]WAI85565.1 FlxA-like family protein [Achromobacter spanius]WEX95647.1 FlxA-like family protein [Achromobacter sp. SS2-2022]WFP10633.1 FlxA-like family protein [Achromobacter spanius]
MAINSIGGTSRIGSLAELWAQKIQANKESKEGADAQATTLTPDGKIRVGAAGAMAVGGSQAAEESSNEDDFARQIKELQKQLKRVMDQIAKVNASGMSAEMKAQQLQALNGQAMQIQGQIVQVMVKQAQAAQGSVSTTA